MSKQSKLGKSGRKHAVHSMIVLLCSGALAQLLGYCGCSQTGGYSDEPLFPSELNSIYVEMFENSTFWRGIEYDLTDAVAKQIEVQTPYKIISDRDRADSVMSGQITSLDQRILSIERETGGALEQEVVLQVTVSWKDLRTGELLVANESISAAGSYSPLQSQGFKYASRLAANNLAQRIVESMEQDW